ncbi:MAG: hypothetical protein HYT94_00010 [Parcubacteria group bacterium]|nr:hypothetical protein [Parcubacteria group bacterium]
MTTKNVYFISALIFFLGFVAGGFVFSDWHILPSGQNDGGQIACPQDAKLCPDGSAVGRTGPNCEFAECPSTPGGQGENCVSDEDCPYGMSCIDLSQYPVGREGAPSNFRCWNDQSPLPICLSGDSKISTPRGETLVKDLKPGMSVWTVDRNGKAMKGIVLRAGKTPAPLWHQVVHLQLSDGRRLFVSPGHRVADGRRAGDVKAGDTLEGIFVASANLIPYDQKYTYDILPSGDTGMYFANGILLRSTLQ